jgi:glutathione S-transferase
MADAPVVLHQFLYSHYNEKARWALDWKRVSHRRVTYLPGPHVPAIRRLSGQTATPVLCLDDEVVAGSARILDALERRFPERPLLPADDVLRSRALAIQERFDREVGPAIRTALFSVLLEEPGYLCGIFAERTGTVGRLLYRAGFPLVRGVMARANGVTDPAASERAFAVSREALDFVARESERSGQLVGDAFSVADLAAASLLALVANPPHPDMARSTPIPERVQAFLAGWASHPGAHWVLEQYRRHRAASFEMVA